MAREVIDEDNQEILDLKESYLRLLPSIIHSKR